MIKSSILENNNLPYWAKICDEDKISGILFRGTYHELKSQEIELTIFNKKNLLTSTLIGSKIVQLREVLEVGFSKTDMVIHKLSNAKD